MTQFGRNILWTCKTVLCATALTVLPAVLSASNAAPQAESDPKAPPAAVVIPADYVIGPEDVLEVVFWRDKDLSAEVAVRPDGKISLPVLNEITAAGLTPEQLRTQISKLAERYVESPTVTVVVKAINSRKVFITGYVEKPGAYALGGAKSVLQLIAEAGGLKEYANDKDIRIMRTEGGQQVLLRFSYKDVSKGKNLEQNIQLKPGDTVIVP
jgi:polysaccharide export outer membrane protein